jgi:hypothetical protein
MMEATFSHEKSESIFKVLRCHNPEDHNLDNHNREYLKISTVGSLLTKTLNCFSPLLVYFFYLKE